MQNTRRENIYRSTIPYICSKVGCRVRVQGDIAEFFSTSTGQFCLVIPTSLLIMAYYDDIVIIGRCEKCKGSFNQCARPILTYRSETGTSFSIYIVLRLDDRVMILERVLSPKTVLNRPPVQLSITDWNEDFLRWQKLRWYIFSLEFFRLHSIDGILNNEKNVSVCGY